MQHGPWALNSNLILLIHKDAESSEAGGSDFKFQSDSINTLPLCVTLSPLTYFKFQSDSINTKSKRIYGVKGMGFKFQSDSINTRRSDER